MSEFDFLSTQRSAEGLEKEEERQMFRMEGRDSPDEDLFSLPHLWECPIDGDLIAGAFPAAENEERSDRLSL